MDGGKPLTRRRTNHAELARLRSHRGEETSPLACSLAPQLTSLIKPTLPSELTHYRESLPTSRLFERFRYYAGMASRVRICRLVVPWDRSRLPRVPEKVIVDRWESQ
jgi:hypothetical protein